MAKKDQKKSDVKSEGQTQAQAAQSALQTAASDELPTRTYPRNPPLVLRFEKAPLPIKKRC